MNVRELDRMEAGALDLFGAVAKAVYAGDPVWARGSEIMWSRQWALRPDRAAGLFRPVVATENGRPLARAVAILNPGSVDSGGHPKGCIGFFDCVADRPDGARAVLDRCERLLADAGVGTIQLPKADNQLFGCQTAGFELPHLCLTPHNPPGYRALFEASGYAASRDIRSYYFTRDSFRAVSLDAPAVATRAFDRSRLDEEIGRFHSLQVAVFSRRPGYVPRTLAEDRAMIEEQLPIIDDDLVIFAAGPDGETLGVLVCLPDFYQALAGQPVDRVRIVSIGILPSRRRQGIGTALGLHLMQTLLAKTRYVFAEISLVLHDNLPPQGLAARFHAHPGRAFVLMEKRL